MTDLQNQAAKELAEILRKVQTEGDGLDAGVTVAELKLVMPNISERRIREMLKAGLADGTIGMSRGQRRAMHGIVTTVPIYFVHQQG